MISHQQSKNIPTGKSHLKYDEVGLMGILQIISLSTFFFCRFICLQMACIKTTFICRQQNHCLHGCTINNGSVKRSLGSAASVFCSVFLFLLFFLFWEVSNSISWITDPDWMGLPVERTAHTLMTNVKPSPGRKALVVDLYWRFLAGPLTL